MITNPFTPGTKSHAIAAAILHAHEHGTWVNRAALMERYTCGKNLIGKVRERLREEGLLGYKGDYTTKETA